MAAPEDFAVTDEVFGRLSAQDFLLELLWLNFVHQSGGNADSIRQLAEQTDRVMQTPGPGSAAVGDAGRAYAIHQTAISHVERFWERLEERYRATIPAAE